MAKVKDIITPRLYTVEVITRSYGGVTSEADPDDEWGRESTWTSWSIQGIRYPAKKYSGDTVEVPFEPKAGETYYLLYAQYSTGDSFGHDEGRNLEIIGLYRNQKIAIANKKTIEEADAKKNNNITLIAENGKKYQMYVPWNGYFESLDHVNIESVSL